MLIAGLASMSQVRQTVAQEFDPNGQFAYQAGTTSGQYYWPAFYATNSEAPPAFLNEWTRSLFYLPSSNGQSDTILVYDRVNALNPETLPGFNWYYAPDQAAIEAAPDLVQWIIHAPVDPTVSGNVVSWSTAGGQQVQVTTLGPQSVNDQIIDENTLWPSPAYSSVFPPSTDQLHYQVRISPTTNTQWTTMLNVVQASDPGTPLENVHVVSDGGEAEGALVERGGLPDTLVLFGAEEAGRVLSMGYTVHFTAGASQTNADFLDLDPTKSWTVSVDGGAAVPMEVSSQGIGQTTVTTAGAHSIQLIAS
jgi:hypothetical protein